MRASHVIAFVAVLLPPLVAAAQPKPEVALHLTDEAGQPLAVASSLVLTAVAEPGRRFRAEASGGVTRYVLAVPPGVYEVEAAARGYQTRQTRITVPAGRGADLSLALHAREAEEDLLGRLAKATSSQRDAVPPGALERALRQKGRMPRPGPPPPRRPACQWTSLGPRNINGRVRALAAHPTRGKTLYAGAANAGVWITRDSGTTWSPLMRDEGSLAVGSLAVHLTDPAAPDGDVTVYAGTGQVEFADTTIFPSYPGVGVLRSTQNGRPGTWTASGDFGTLDVTSLAVDPTSVSGDPDTVILYAGGSGGIFRSADGGKTWNRLTAEINVQSLALDPDDAKTLWAGVTGTGILKIDTLTGNTSTLNNGLALTTGGSPFSLVLIAISPSMPHTSYAKVDQTVYRLSGNTWTSLGDHGGDPYGYWSELLAVDPADSKTLLTGAQGLERSDDSGDHWSSEDGTLSDQHAAAFSSADHRIVYVGNDHGVWRRDFAETAGSWSKASNGLILTQFNTLGSSPAGPNLVGGGSQDNDTERTLGGLTWDDILHGDGDSFVADPADPHHIYAQQSWGLGDPRNGFVLKSDDGAASFQQLDTGVTFPGGPFVTPLLLDPASPADPDRKLFVGGRSQVFRSTDGSASWKAASPDLGGEVRTLALATSGKALWAGLPKRKVWFTANRDATTPAWTEVTTGTASGSAVLPNRRLTRLAADPADGRAVYATFGGWAGGATGPFGHVFHGAVARNGTVSWTDISGNLPDVPANALAVDPAEPGRLWVGTDIGVFTSADGGTTWGDFNGDALPNVVVSALELDSQRSVLRAATYGWGMWQRQLKASCPATDLYVRDSRIDTGETFPSPSGVPDPGALDTDVYWWQSPDIKVSTGPAPRDGVEFDQMAAESAVRGTTVPIYIQVHNRGPETVHHVKVAALWIRASAGVPALPDDFWATFPGPFQAASEWKLIDPAVPFQTIDKLLPHTPAILRWDFAVPQNATEDSCAFVAVSSDEDLVTRSDSASDHLVEVVVPGDKHVTQRNLHIVDAGVPPPGGSAAPEAGMRIDLHNPDRSRVSFEIVADRGNLPRGSRVAILLPHVLPASTAGAVPLAPVTGQEWWAGAERRRGGTWELAADLPPGSGRRHFVLPSFIIRGRDHVTAGIAVALPPGAPPGAVYRFSVLERRKGGRVIGGGSYELRVPERRVVVGEKP